jgi:hypothetical protein
MADETDPALADWSWWNLAVEHPELIGTDKLPIHEGEPQTGLYRIRRKDGPWETLQLFRDDTGWQAERNGRRISDRNHINDLWLRACRNPVREAAFERAVAGEGWIDEPPSVPRLGHNLPGDEVDPLDRLRIEYLGEAEAAREFLKEPITDQASADRAAIWADRLMTIGNRADALHKVEKQPSLDEGRRIDNRWRELREEAPALARLLKRHNTAWLQELDRREQVRVAAARAEADKLRRQAEDAARLAVSPDAVAAAGKKISEAQAVARDAEYHPPQAGRTGAKTFLKTYTSAKVTDWPMLIAYLADNAEMRALAQTLADRAAKGGNPFPGTEIFREKRAS